MSVRFRRANSASVRSPSHLGQPLRKVSGDEGLGATTAATTPVTLRTG